MAGQLVARRPVPALRHQQPHDEQRHLGAAPSWRSQAVSVSADRRLRELGRVLARWQVGGVQLDRTGTIEVYVSPFPSNGKRWRVSADGGSQARWRRDGSEIFYLAPDRTVIAVSVTIKGHEFTVNGYEPLFEIRHPYGAYHAFDVTDDAKRFLVNTLVVNPGGATVVAVNSNPLNLPNLRNHRNLVSGFQNPSKHGLIVRQQPDGREPRRQRQPVLVRLKTGGRAAAIHRRAPCSPARRRASTTISTLSGTSAAAAQYSRNAPSLSLCSTARSPAFMWL